MVPGALVLTFDNLGEASELERGTWPTGAPLGAHRSVSESLPRLLDELDRHSLSATFFVEAINCEIYPRAVLEIAARRHELGMHGWRHESWAELPPDRERELLVRGVRAFGELGIEVRCFRPPGGALSESSPALLREAGLHYVSPAGTRFGARDGLVYVPFEWRFVDAYHLMERFSGLRERLGDSPQPADPEPLAERLCEQLGALPGPRTVILHPFLMLDQRWWRGVQMLLARAGALAAERGIWVGPLSRL
jgi:peptidoglycan/xylan/chitin deacetylase (PgdA/CDA1 family)